MLCLIPRDFCAFSLLSSRGRGLGLRTVAIRGQLPWMSCPQGGNNKNVRKYIPEKETKSNATK